MNPFSDYLNPNNPKYDPYLPAQVNLNLQQFDNYCIYEIAGITYYSNINQTVVEIDSFVAYQRFDITPVTVDFRALVDKYHDFGIVKSGKFWNLFALIGYQHTYKRYVTSNGIVVEPRSPVFAQGSYYPPTTISIGDSKFDNQVLIDYAWNNKSNFPITTNSYYKNTPDGINRDVSSPYIFDTSLAKTNAQIITTGAPLNLAKQITLSTLNNKAGIPYKFAATFFFLWQPQAINLKPNYSDLITGYARDSRKIPTKLTITAFSNIILDIKHYRKIHTKVFLG